jgi:hypothetical protein
MRSDGVKLPRGASAGPVWCNVPVSKIALRLIDVGRVGFRQLVQFDLNELTV